jgi:integrase
VEAVGLGDARAQARHLQELVARGVDPIQAKRSGMPLATPERSPTFAEVATKWFETQAPGWRSESQPRNVTLILYGHGRPFSSVPLAEITPEHIEAALRTLRTTAPDQARRALRIYFKVFQFAAARGFQSPSKLNPATWEGLHETWWPKQNGVKKHFDAMPYARLPEFMRQLRVEQSIYPAAAALEFLILTATRTGETLNAQWGEIDFDARVWTIPATRTKTGKQHQVPLSARVLELLERQRQYTKTSPFVFPGRRGRMNEKALRLVLRSMNVQGVTVHGFRSSFSDWSGEETEFDTEAVEFCLSHSVGNAVRAAYRRKTALEKRRVIMDAWAAFLDQQTLTRFNS